MNDTIEATESLGNMKSEIQELQSQVNSLKERQMESLNANIRLQEKAADAYVLSKEASAISKATQRELEATSNNIKSEVDTAIKGMNDKLEVLKRATTNPLGR